ncbi:MAG: tRNA glutamyl-Q(34) synthetase GluQRS [Verrucomicrobiales bacterium]|nr:tRNA glutamyl-Q(34) synthetase GluQRS [Verrucomicrobiales bacterium]
MSIVTRFAPSPSGRLHLGHAYSALRAWDFAQQQEGNFLLRIEDIDFNRCKAEFEDLLKTDLAWLGLRWSEPTRRQSEHLDYYQSIAHRLETDGFLYPCFCTRKEILAEIARAGAAPHGSEGPVYPGTCRDLSEDERTHRIKSGRDYAMRFDLASALEKVGRSLTWSDLENGEIPIAEKDWAELGDVVLVRKDIQTSYHLAVVADDFLQGVTHIIRGRDLFESTHIHVLLQHLLDMPQPIYLHHELVTDQTGKRLAKRDESETLAALRESGVSPAEIRERLGLLRD